MMFLLLVVVSFVGPTTSELLHVDVIFRHGDRSPMPTIYPNDPYQIDTWPAGYGQLTKIGMEEGFQLGRFLRARYDGFISSTYNRTEIYVRSTDIDRTLMTAQACTAGLYFPKSTKDQFRQDLRWNPVPVHTVANKEDYLLFEPSCLRVQSLLNEVFQSPIVQNINRQNKDIFSSIAKSTGVTSFSFTSVSSLWDTLFCEQAHNLTLPKWVTNSVKETLQNLTDFAYKLRCSTTELRRLQGGALLYEVLSHLRMLSQLEKGSLPVGGKMFLYSAHDTTVAPFLCAAGVFNNHWPPYTAAVMVELHKENDQFFARLFYRNDTKKPPMPLTVPGCAHSCPITNLTKLWKPAILPSWEKPAACKSHTTLLNRALAVKMTTTISYTLAVLSGAGLVGVLSFIIVYAIRKRRYRLYTRLNVTRDDESTLEMNGIQ